MQTEPLKFARTVFNSKTRANDCAWRTLEQKSNRAANKQKAKEPVKSSTHLDSQNCSVDAAHRNTLCTQHSSTESSRLDYLGCTVDNKPEISDSKEQDLRVMLKQAMSSHKEAEDKDRFDWDFRHGSVDLASVSLVLFVPMYKVNGVEVDKMTGQFGANAGNDAGLCHVCLCPTNASNRRTSHANSKPQAHDIGPSQEPLRAIFLHHL